MSADNTIREYVRHKVFRDVFAIERIADTSQVVAAARVDPRTTCKHLLGAITLDLAAKDVEDMTAQWDDYEPADLPCLDAVHLLNEIGDVERECKDAQREYETKHGEAKIAKQELDAAIARLRELVSRSTSVADLPLFDRLDA